ncbi:MAG: capsular exopolysaccharide family [Firmicutes bacterium]|nr:capsular exopolysaccharide family [Bacillota bacterium]
MCAQRRLIVHEQAKSPIAEAFRTLRTNIQFSKIDGGLHTILFTSAGPGEGKSTVIANTAVAMAQAGKKVILLDCDLRKPTQHKIFHLKSRGVTNSIVEDIPILELLLDTEIANLRVVTSGPIPPNPSELLGSAHMSEILDTLQKECDILLIDVPPAVAVTDACVLASRVDGVVIVLDSVMVRPDMAQKTRDLIRKAHGNILGVILNRVEIEKEHSYYYYYYGKEAPKR